MITNFLNNIILKWYDWSKDPYYNNKYTFTSDNNYTHAIFVNKIINNIKKLPKKNIVGVSVEPRYHLGINNEFIKFCKKNVKTYYVGNNQDLPNPFIQKVGFVNTLTSFNNLPKLCPDKTKIMNFVHSNKMIIDPTLLYSYRQIIDNAIINNNLDIDFYGSCIDRLKILYPNKEKYKIKI